MEPWREAWRTHVAPNLPLKGLEALRAALLADDPALVQRSVVSTNWTVWDEPKPISGGCAIGLSLWKGCGLTDYGDVLDRYCNVGDFRNRTTFTAWFDEQPRAVVLRELLPEVSREIARRTQQPAEDGTRAEEVKSCRLSR